MTSPPVHVDEPFTVTTGDGWRLLGDVRLPAGRPRGVVVAGHAMMVDRRTLDRPRGRGLVSLLAARGYAVVWPDLRGHGRSGPRAEEGGDWSYDALVDEDVPALLGFARARFPGLPVAALGHSLFGHVTLAHLARRGPPLEALVLLAANVANPSWRARPLGWVWKQAPTEALALLTRLRGGRLPARRLRLGSDDEPASYVRQFVANGRAASWRARDGFDWFAHLARVRTPVLAIAASGDRLFAPPADVRALVAAVPGARVEEVGRKSGLGRELGHMGLVLDEAARPVWERIADWLDATLAGSSGAAAP